MQTEFTTKTTCINGRYHTRLMYGDRVIDEMACALKIDTSWCYAEMLRWQSKMGRFSIMAEASRTRSTKKHRKANPQGRVWGKGELDAEKLNIVLAID